jgi:hypothetical protein
VSLRTQTDDASGCHGPRELEKEVTIVESTSCMSMTALARLRTVTFGHAQGELMRTSSGLRTALTVPGYGAIQGTTVSAVAATAVKANALLPISDVVVFDGAAGIRSWSPPV